MNNSIVTFIRCNVVITLKHGVSGYYLTSRRREKEISSSLAQYIILNYKPGQIQPNSRYS